MIRGLRFQTCHPSGFHSNRRDLPFVPVLDNFFLAAIPQYHKNILFLHQENWLYSWCKYKWLYSHSISHHLNSILNFALFEKFLHFLLFYTHLIFIQVLWLLFYSFIVFDSKWCTYSSKPHRFYRTENYSYFKKMG